MLFHLLSLLFLYLPQKEIEINIYNYSIEKDVLYLNYCIKNNTNNNVQAIFNMGFSTIPNFSILSLLIIENDTVFLHVEDPTSYPNRPVYTLIKSHDSICKVIKVDLNKLYTLESLLFSGQPHQVKGKCSFQLIYYDKLLENGEIKFGTSAGKGIKQKNLKPITDTLYSNIIYLSPKEK